ncbi:unnamed protein product [Ixodes hexagonus]
MGLCKCPKKKVTNQFCYEHRVNVCEHCMVSQHPTASIQIISTCCIVQSYLQWLQDSDYDPICQLCRQGLGTDACTRLLCYHVFHWSCLDRHCQQMPRHTAPAGFGCPTCGAAVVPATNVASPVADALKLLLRSTDWANASPTSVAPPPQQVTPPRLAGPTGDTPSVSSGPALPVTPSVPSQWGPKSPSSALPTALHSSAPSENSIGAYGSSANSNVTSARKVFTATQGSFVTSAPDYDEDKYKRRSGFELLSRWIKSRTVLGGNRRRDPHAFLKRWVILSILLTLALFTLVYFLMHWGRASADSDPLLDPRFNPEIHVRDEPHLDQSLDNAKNPAAVGGIEPR